LRPYGTMRILTRQRKTDHAAVRYVTPLRYPGGKSKLAGFVARLLEKNELSGGTYVEPYAGGASVALYLLTRGHVSAVHINDVDPAVYAFWHSVLNDTERLCRLVSNRRVSVAEWQRQHTVQRNLLDHDLLERGFSTFFLNRTNRSGIICSGGMIGGVEQNGKWKLDARYNKKELLQRIERIAGYRDRIALHQEDAAHLLDTLTPTLPRNSFLYLDPPYYVKGRRRLYANFYSHSDHAKIADAMAELKTPWMVSYDDQREVRALYRGFRSSKYSLTYTAHKRALGAEVMFFSAGLKVPMQRF
jgi:DNA adenine methylase